MANDDINATQTLDRMATTIVCQLTWLQSFMARMNCMALMAWRLSPGVPTMSFDVLIICNLRFVSCCSKRPNNFSSLSSVMLKVSANSPVDMNLR